VGSLQNITGRRDPLTQGATRSTATASKKTLRLTREIIIGVFPLQLGKGLTSSCQVSQSEHRKPHLLEEGKSFQRRVGKPVNNALKLP